MHNNVVKISESKNDMPDSSNFYEYAMGLFSAALSYMEERPYLTASYLLAALIITILASYKWPSLKRACRRRRSRNRRRKPRTHYYYLNKSSADKMAENSEVADPLIGGDGSSDIQLGGLHSSSKKLGKKKQSQLNNSQINKNR